MSELNKNKNKNKKSDKTTNVILALAIAYAHLIYIELGEYSENRTDNKLKLKRRLERHSKYNLMSVKVAFDKFTENNQDITNDELFKRIQIQIGRTKKVIRGQRVRGQRVKPIKMIREDQGSSNYASTTDENHNIDNKTINMKPVDMSGESEFYNTLLKHSAPINEKERFSTFSEVDKKDIKNDLRKYIKQKKDLDYSKKEIQIHN